MKRFFALLGLASLTSLAAADLNTVGAPADTALLVISSKPVPLNRDNPAQSRVGELVYRGGLELRSPNRDFGGISDFRILKNNSVLAISDTGSWIGFHLIERKDRLVGVKGYSLAPILGLDGMPGVKMDRDAEGLALMEHQTVVTFENQNARWFFPAINPQNPSDFNKVPHDTDYPKSWSLWPKNGGPEAYDQRIYPELGIMGLIPFTMSLTIAEDAFNDRGATDAELNLSELEIKFRYQTPHGFKPTATALIDDKRALILHRNVSLAAGFSATVSELPIGKIKSDTIVQSREIARLESPLTVDNMEGISYIERKGRKYIYIISDDNFSGMQRTLLMKFEWFPKTPEGKPDVLK
jgi:hypothetical protein